MLTNLKTFLFSVICGAVFAATTVAAHPGHGDVAGANHSHSAEFSIVLMVVVIVAAGLSWRRWSNAR